MGKIRALLRLTRIEHSIMLVIAVLAAELISGGLPTPVVLAASIITPILISMASFAINDYFDIAVDKLNKKKGPLVAGELTPKDALYTTLLCLVVGIFASALINPYCFVIAAFFGALAVLYSYKLKETLLLGNFYIGFSMAIPFIYGSYAVTQNIPVTILLVSLMIFLSGVAREIHGTIRDLEGDSKVRKVMSLPKIFGVGFSSAVALALYLIAIAISVYLFLNFSPFAGNYLYAGIILIADLILVYVSFGYLVSRSKSFYKRSRNLSLGAMALALIAILAAVL